MFAKTFGKMFGTTSYQKKLMLGINVFSIFFLYWFTTQITNAYIGLAYPDVADTTVKALTTFPSGAGLITALLIGPIAMRFSKWKLAVCSIAGVVIYNIIFYFNGLLHGPFVLYYVACVFAGIAQGSHATLLNSLISLHVAAKDRGEYIAGYNVFLNIGSLIVYALSGILAAPNGGLNWYNAYLLGLGPVVGMVFFAIQMKRIDADNPTDPDAIRDIGKAENAGQKAKLSDIPKSVLAWLLVLGLAHGLYYFAQFGYNAQISSYVITEYNLGTSAQAGYGSTILRFVMIFSTLMFPIWKMLFKRFQVPIGYLVIAVGLFIMMKGKSLPAAYTCAAMVGLATGIVFSAAHEKGASLMKAQYVPMATATIYFLTCLFQFTSVYIMDFFAKPFGGDMSVKFTVAIIAALIAVVIALFAYVFSNPKSMEQLEAEQNKA